MRKVLAVLAVATALCCAEPRCLANSLLPQGGSLNLAIFTDSTSDAILGFDIRGGVQVGIFDPLNDPLGGVLVSDGTLLGNPAPPVPNSLLIVTDLGVTQNSFLEFSNLAISGPGALLQGDILLTGGSITDPALSLFDTLGPFTFGFAFSDQEQYSSTELVTNFSLASIVSETPEPATFPLGATGLLLAFVATAIHRRKSRTQTLSAES